MRQTDAEAGTRSECVHPSRRDLWRSDRSWFWFVGGSSGMFALVRTRCIARHTRGSANRRKFDETTQKRRRNRSLRRRKANWLRSAAKDMAKTMEREWKEYANA